MITKFKTFENVSEPFKVGDYAVIPIRIKNVVNDYIVKIVEITKDNEILYKRDDNDTTTYVTYAWNVKYWSDSKEELEIKINSKKYNI